MNHLIVALTGLAISGGAAVVFLAVVEWIRNRMGYWTLTALLLEQRRKER